MATGRISVTQIDKIGKVYESNIKKYYKSIRDSLLEEKHNISESIRGEYKEKISRRIKAENKNLKIDSITFYDKRIIVKFNIERNYNLIMNALEDSGFGDKYEFCSYSTTLTPEVKIDIENVLVNDAHKFDEINARIEQNCHNYKLKMKELNQWTLDALATAHEGKLPNFEVEAIEPSECII